jgi:ribosomal protein L11 methyltransferase
MRYLRRTYTVADEARDELIAALWEAGTLGIDEGSTGLPPEPAGGAPASATPTPLVAWFVAAETGVAVVLPAGAALLAEEWSGEEDWLATYRAQAQPLAIGDRLWVDPREPDAPPLPVPGGRIALRIPARTAFGTGSHASTRLVLRLLERLPLNGARVLDVGTGSGILALAALALGAQGALGFDVDPAAALLAGQHARLNREAVPIEPVFWAGSVAALARGGFDLVLANALPHELRDDAARLTAALAPAGRLIVSGVPSAEAAEVADRWAVLGLHPEQQLVEEEWTAFVLRASQGPTPPETAV